MDDRTRSLHLYAQLPADTTVGQVESLTRIVDAVGGTVESCSRPTVSAPSLGPTCDRYTPAYT